MSVYYVSTTGSDSNNGLSAATPFRTLGKVVTVEAAGDTCYIAPGWYRECVTVTASGTAGSLITWIADIQGAYTLSQPGRVVVTGRTKTGDVFVHQLSPTLTFTDRQFRRFEYMIFISQTTNAAYAYSATPCAYEQVQFWGCSFLMEKESVAYPAIYICPDVGATPATSGMRFDHCTFLGSLYFYPVANVTANYDLKVVANRCIFLGAWNSAGGLWIERNGSATSPNNIASGYTIQHCLFMGGTYTIQANSSGFVAGSVGILAQNCITMGASGSVSFYGVAAKPIDVRNCHALQGSMGLSSANGLGYAPYTNDMVLAGFFDMAVTKLLADVGVRTDLFSPVLVPDTVSQYMLSSSYTGITPTADLYGSYGNNHFVIAKFAGTVTDPDSAWTSDSNIADYSFSTVITSLTAGSDSSKYLQIAGTEDITGLTLGTISAVYLRVFMRTASSTYTLGWKVYTSGLSETLGTGTITPATHASNTDPRVQTEILLTAPTGGWTASAISNLVIRLWRTAGTAQAAQVDVVAICSSNLISPGPVSPVTPTAAVVPQRAMTSTRTVWGPVTGNPIYGLATGTWYGFALDDSNDSAGGEIQFSETGSVTHCGLFVSAIAGTPPAYKVSLCQLNATTGVPDEASAYGGSAPILVSSFSVGWNWIQLPTPASVVRGGRAAVVIVPDSVAPSPSNCITVLIGSGAAAGILGTGRMFYRSISWMDGPGTGPFAAQYSNGHVDGLAIRSNVSFINVARDTTPSEVAAEFIPSTTITVGGLVLSFLPNYENYTTLTATLYDSSNTVLASSGPLHRTATEVDPHPIILIEPIELTSGNIYRIAVKGGDGGANYRLPVIVIQFASEQAKKVWPYGDSWCATQRTGTGSWQKDELSIVPFGLLIDRTSYGEVRMASIMEGFPLNAEIIGADRAELNAVNGRMVLEFDADTDETADWTFVAPQSALGSSLTMYIFYAMASATTGTVVFQAQVEAISPGDTVDLDAATNFDTANSGSGTVPGTAGHMTTVAIVLDNRASMAEGDLVRVRLSRDANNGSDSATGDCYVYAVEIRNT